MSIASPEIVHAATTLNTPLHNLVRVALIEAYKNPFNEGKVPDPFLIESMVHNVAESIADDADATLSEPRTLAFEAIETERLYQDAGFGNAANTNGNRMTPGEIVLCIDKINGDAKHAWYKPGSTAKVGELMRKVGALAVQYMERYGATPRAFTPDQQVQLQVHGILKDAFAHTRATDGERRRAYAQ